MINSRQRFIRWLRLKTRPFVNIEDAEKFVRHFKSFNPGKKFKTGFSDDDVVVFVGSIGAEIGTQTQKNGTSI